MRLLKRITVAAGAAAVCLAAVPQPAAAENYGYVAIERLKEAPQIYWAKGIVFRDVLTSLPGSKELRVDDRLVIRFETEGLGYVYAEEEARPLFENLETGREYYFAGTIAQRKGRYYYIASNVSPFINDAEYLEELIARLNRDNPDNEYNQIFMVLEQIMEDVHNDLFGYSTTSGIPLSELIGNRDHRVAVASAVRTALRRFEDQSKGSSQELFVSVIVSMMALQYGYADTSTPGEFVPSDPAVPSVEERAIEPEPETGMAEAAYDAGSEDEWDLSGWDDLTEEMVAEAVTAPPEPAAEPEAVPATVNENTTGEDMMAVEEAAQPVEAEPDTPESAPSIDAEPVPPSVDDAAAAVIAEEDAGNLTVEATAEEVIAEPVEDTIGESPDVSVEPAEKIVPAVEPEPEPEVEPEPETLPETAIEVMESVEEEIPAAMPDVTAEEPEDAVTEVDVIEPAADAAELQERPAAESDNGAEPVAETEEERPNAEEADSDATPSAQIDYSRPLPLR